MLSLAHAAASTSSAWCGWYGSTYNFPKGNNNGALGDANDSAILYVSDGSAYPGCALTGSANLFNRTAHNGQNCGVVDLNGNIWEITPGLTSDGANFYVLRTSAKMANMTASNSAATDLWGSGGIAALYDSLGATYGAALATNTVKYFGATGQVISAATNGNDWKWCSLGLPLSVGVGGTNQFGNDGLWDYRPNELCPLSGGYWSTGSDAGVWACYLGGVRSTSDSNAGFRSALYL